MPARLGNPTVAAVQDHGLRIVPARLLELAQVCNTGVYPRSVAKRLHVPALNYGLTRDAGGTVPVC